MIKLRKEHPALAEDGEFKVILSGYPTIYERSLNDEKIRVIINPSDRECKLDGINAKEIYVKQNRTIRQKRDNLTKRSSHFIIFRE